MNLPSQTKLVIKFWFPFTIRWHVFHHPCYKPRNSSKIRHNFSKLKRGEGNFQRELFVDWLQKGEFLVDLCINFGGCQSFLTLYSPIFLGGRAFAIQGNTFYLIGKQRLVFLKVDKLPPLVTVCTSCFLLLRHGPQAFLNVKLNYSPRSSVMEKIHCGTLAALQQQEWRADSLTGIIRLKYI